LLNLRNVVYELFQAFETSGMSLMADSQYSAQTRVQVLLEFLHEREMDLEDLAEMKRVKLEQCVQLCQFQNDANQVTGCPGIGNHTSVKGTSDYIV
jgi:triple functional domain protein